eukprot:TRINITY_DN27032_c0_g1_i1.p1 TRINITY_DN27032_c0_g1~~TRINITY_DN27032_c0_g1_i1.p1  ORF type:complete len:152 (-),score=10.86 TRINITY_DN27032_c0_g1_i1:136-591(-)
MTKTVSFANAYPLAFTDSSIQRRDTRLRSSASWSRNELASSKSEAATRTRVSAGARRPKTASVVNFSDKASVSVVDLASDDVGPLSPSDKSSKSMPSFGKTTIEARVSRLRVAAIPDVPGLSSALSHFKEPEPVVRRTPKARTKRTAPVSA